jgi:hypothetical protein
MFNIITTYYESNNIKRQNEINECLSNNIKNSYIKKIYLLNDNKYSLDFITDQTKIVQIIVDDNNKKRLGYDCIINFINNNLIGEICIISNSDIYFDDTLKYINNMNNKVYALSRYDNDVLFNRADSQDCWIFTAPLNVNISDCNFKIGIPGCDNRIAYIIKKSNYILTNPSKTIKTHHLHTSNIRTYDRSTVVKGPYVYISPTYLE